jgi:hypothetical protein
MYLLQDRTLSQIEQFWSYLMWTDENIDEKNIRNSVLVCIVYLLQ